MRKINFYKKLIERVKSVVRAARVPKSFSKKNNNVFSNEKHIIMSVLMQLEKKHYRDMPAFLKLLQKEIGLRRIPCFSTINKFVLRIKHLWLEQLIARIVKSEQACLIAIDGTGFSLNFRSPYFTKIAGERNRFLQCVAAFDTQRKLITAAKIRRKKRHENIDAPYLMKQSAKQLKIDYFVADKAFDCEKNHELAESYGAKFIAPLKGNGKIPIRRTRGYHRKQLKRNFPREIYNKRASAENGYSVIKRRYGDVAYSKKFVAQKNEILFRIIAYNIEKVINSSVLLIYFTQSPKSVLLEFNQKPVIPK